MTVVITGGSGAIGSMCAYVAAKSGYNIVLCYNNNEKSAESVVDMLSGFDVKIQKVKADLTDTAELSKVADAANQLGGVDILINNAGVSQIKDFGSTTTEDTYKMI